MPIHFSKALGIVLGSPNTPAFNAGCSNIDTLPANARKDLEIVLLRQQLAIVDRQCSSRVRLSSSEKLALAVLTVKRKSITRRTTRQLSK
jgi:hypothetical protein